MRKLLLLLTVFERGQWKIELFWDKDNEDKAIYLGGAYFEIY